MKLILTEIFGHLKFILAFEMRIKICFLFSETLEKGYLYFPAPGLALAPGSDPGSRPQFVFQGPGLISYLATPALNL